jgi:hypothetical protein
MWPEDDGPDRVAWDIAMDLGSAGKRRARRPKPARSRLIRGERRQPPILNIFVPHTGQEPWVAGLPFFMVIFVAFCISRFALHLTQ